jgi:eukaryotic-like serine/threonine-protein kinase
MDITAEKWAVLSALLDEALALSPSARDAWLGSLQGPHLVYRDELQGFLDDLARIETSDFLATLPKFKIHENIQPDAVAAGTQIGPYIIDAELGRGGMGIVYRAHRADGLLKRTTALKLLHSAHASSELIARFARERDILAGLTHQGIARLYDAGLSQSGQPYIALEYVDGLPLVAYCDEHRLDIPSRLALMIQVMQAVQFAHANLVIHRDLKPSNILVTAGGEVRLLDFGIAKPIHVDSLVSAVTQFGARAATPEYASPEQIRGDAVSIATDVYSLGVLLYEVLCGRRPYRLERSSAAALEEAILSADPVRPSAAPLSQTDAASRSTTVLILVRTLAGDLDSIVLKALKKSPADRYATADAFAQDIERFLKGQPVQAQPEKAWYRAKKFLRRNAVAVSATLAMMVALAAGLGVALWQAQRANEEARVARSVETFLQDVFGANSKDNTDQVKAQQTTARELLDIGTSKIDSGLADSPRAKLEVLATLGSMYHDLGLDDKAAVLLQRRVDLARQLYGTNNVRLADALRDLSMVLPNTLRVKDRPAVLAEALAILDRAGDRTSTLRANVLGDLAQHYTEFDLPKALVYAHASSELMKNRPPSEDLQEALLMEGVVLQQLARYNEALPLFLSAISVSKRTFGDPNPHLPHLFVYAAKSRYYQLDFAGAERDYREALKVAHDLLGPNHTDTLQAQLRLGLFLGRTGRNREAVGALREAHERATATLPADEAFNLPSVRESLGWELAHFGLLDEGYALLANATATWKRRYDGSAWVISALERSAYLLVDRGDYATARKLLDEASQVRATLKDATTYRNGNEVARIHLELAVGNCVAADLALQHFVVAPMTSDAVTPSSLDAELLRAEIALAGSDYEAARLVAADALDAIRRTSNRVYVRGYEARALLVHGQALLGARSPEQALPLLREAVTMHHDLYDSESSVLVAGADLALARCLAALGRASEALAWIAEAEAIFDRHATLGLHWRQSLESARAALPRSAPRTSKTSII